MISPQESDSRFLRAFLWLLIFIQLAISVWVPNSNVSVVQKWIAEIGRKIYNIIRVKKKRIVR